jgi:hypothetical protein
MVVVEFKIEFKGDIDGQKTEVDLYSIYGNLVKKISVSGEYKINVNTKDLSAGIYFYLISLNNRQLIKDKIVIIK